MSLSSNIFGDSNINEIVPFPDTKEIQSLYNSLDRVIAPIVNGFPANLEHYNFLVHFLNYLGFCAGNILTHKIILTAAHCFDDNKDVSKMTIVSGSRFQFDPASSKHKVLGFKIHKKYNKSVRFANDIALIKVKDNIKYFEYAGPGSLVNTDKWMTERETKFKVAGWGELELKGHMSRGQLMAAHMRYIARDRCQKWSKLELSPSMFCLFANGTDTCRGDSGGAVIWRKKIVGLVSFGRSCGKYPSVYTNVYYFKNWISKQSRKLNKKH